MIYCDTSLLFSFFVGDDLESEAIRQLDSLNEEPDFLCWTAWHDLEFRTALERHVTNVQKSTTRADAEAIYQQLEEWKRPGEVFKVMIPDWESVMNRAQSLAGGFAAKHAARSLDIVHVALAKQLEVREFWSFDNRQRGLADDCGLRVNAFQLIEG